MRGLSGEQEKIKRFILGVPTDRTIGLGPLSLCPDGGRGQTGMRGPFPAGLIAGNHHRQGLCGFPHPLSSVLSACLRSRNLPDDSFPLEPTT